VTIDTWKGLGNFRTLTITERIEKTSSPARLTRPRCNVILHQRKQFSRPRKKPVVWIPAPRRASVREFGFRHTGKIGDKIVKHNFRLFGRYIAAPIVEAQPPEQYSNLTRRCYRWASDHRRQRRARRLKIA
jgi:hypothetical protein